MQTSKPYTAPKLLDRMASELAYERILAADLRAQLANPHYSLNREEREYMKDLHEISSKKIAVIEKLVSKGSEVASPDIGEHVSTSTEPSTISIPQNTETLLESAIEAGMLAFQSLSEAEKLRIQAKMFLKRTHGALKVTAVTLHDLSPELVDEVRSFLYVLLGEHPNARKIIEEVLRAPRPSRKK